MQNNLLIKGLVLVVVLFIGVSVIPTTTSFQLKERFDTTENNISYQTSQINPRDIDNNKHFNYERNQYYSSRFFSDERFNHCPHELFGYEEIDSNYQNVLLTEISNNKDYTPHDPINIQSNAGFTEENGVTGGSGTEGDPYIIEGWEINGDGRAIFICQTTSHFIVRDCKLTASYAAVEFVDVIFGTLSNLIAYGDSFGIHARECSDNFIIDCDVFSNNNGIYMYRSKNFILKNVSIDSNEYNLGIDGTNAEHYYHDIDTSNMVDGKPVYYIYNQSDLVFDGSEDIGFLGLIKCNRISVEGLTIDIGNRFGILLVETTDSSIVSSTVSNSCFCIRLFKSSNNIIIDSKTSGTNTIYGIDLCGGSSNNSIHDCEVKGGILLEKAPFNIMRNNIITGNYLNFQVFGNKISHFYQDIDDSNIINGKPIYYFIEEDNLDISGSNVGYLGFVNCTNVKVHDVTMQYLSSGILLVNTDGVVENCELRACSWGVHLFMCSDVKIIDCNFKNNFCGVYLHYSFFNQVLRCDLSSNWWHGCLLENSDNNSVDRCDVYFTGMDAFFIEDSFDNKMHYNNIANSGQNGLFAISSSVNATLNWWGHKSGPGQYGPGDGDEIAVVNSIVLFDPWLKSPRSKQFNYSYSDLFMRLLERFPLLQKLLLFL